MKSEKRDTEGTLRQKSYAFAVRIVKMVRFLRERQQEYVLSKQVLRSGTAVGALVREAEFAQTPADFITKLFIALKEGNETDYWLNLLNDTDYLGDEAYESVRADCKELIAMLVASIKTARRNTAK